MRPWLKSLLTVVLLTLPNVAVAELDVSGRHVIFVHPGLDEQQGTSYVKGSYIFLVRNSGSQEEAAEIKLMLPEETVDWMPHEGIGPNELKPGVNGGLVLQKNFPAGETMVSLGFIVLSEAGEAKMTFKPEYALGELGIFYRSASLEVVAPGFKEQNGVAFSGHQYDTVSRSAVDKGEVLQVTLKGLPEGRDRFFYGGIFTIGIVVLGAGFFTWRTRPRKKDATILEV